LLNEIDSGSLRPATGNRRRSFLFGLLVALAGAAGLAGAWDTDPAGPPLALEALRKSSFGAARALAPEQPAAATLIERLIAEAEVITADELTAPRWERSPGRVEAAWSRVQLEAHRALALGGMRRRGLDERWRGLRDAVRADVRSALAEAGEAGLGRREISAAKQAQLRWLLAERYAASGALDRALAEAEAARTFTRVVHDGFAGLHARFRDPKNLSQWRRMVEETVAQSKASGGTAFVVDKLKRKLHVYSGGKRVATYEAELGAKGLRQKMHSGDQATPEGRYKVSQVKGHGRTKYYRALLINYPNDEDRARYAWGKRVGQVPVRAGIGSLIEIHGDGGQGRDWTDGCVALANPDMDEVFARARVGTPVTIVGTY
jgi:L,D-peptidoglycan transpeptidase YkuD (ErfK/YbiS/YcfS/YnhG family)